MVKIPEQVKNIGKNIGVQFAIGVARGFLNEQIKNVTAGDLYKAIQNNEDLWQVTPDKVKNKGGSMGNRFKGILEQYKDEIDTDLILKWMKEDHPELFSTILNTPGGVEYIAGQVEKIKQKII